MRCHHNCRTRFWGLIWLPREHMNSSLEVDKRPATSATWQLHLWIPCGQWHMAGILGRTKGVAWKQMVNALPSEETQSTERTHTTHRRGTGYQRESMSCAWLQKAERAHGCFHSECWCMCPEVTRVETAILDLRRVNLQMHIHKSLWPYQTVMLKGCRYCLTHLGFRLNEVSMIMQTIMRATLSQDPTIKQATLSYINDMYINEAVGSANKVKEHLES